MKIDPPLGYEHITPLLKKALKISLASDKGKTTPYFGGSPDAIVRDARNIAATSTSDL